MSDFDFYEPDPIAEDAVWLKSSKDRKDYEKGFWGRLIQNRQATVGLALLLLATVLTFICPFFNPYSYSQQDVRFASTPPVLRVTKVAPEVYVFVNNALRVIEVTEDGHLYDLPQLAASSTAMEPIYCVAGKNVSAHFDEHKNIIVSVDGHRVLKNASKRVWNKSYWLGTDALGRDLLARVVYGTRISLYVGIFSALISAIFGSIYGGIAGYASRRVGEFMMRIIDIIDSIPLLLVVILLMMLVSPSLKTVVLTIGMLYWTGVARQVRGQILSLRESEFILAARVLGVPSRKIIFRHLIPNSIVQIIIAMTVDVPTAIFSEAFLSFLGLGVSIPKASLGSLINDAIESVRIFPYQVFIPSIAIAFIVFSFNILGAGLQQILNPEKQFTA